VLIFVVVLLVLLIIHLHRLPIVNGEVLQQALAYREHQVPSLGEQHMDLWGTSLTKDEELAGVGVALYFRAQAFVGFCVFGIVVASASVHFWSGLRIGGASSDCGSLVGDDGHTMHAYTEESALTLWYSYWAILCATAWFLYQPPGLPTMQDYALEVRGLPTDLVDPAALRDPKVWPGLSASDIVGASICYDYSDRRWEVEVAAELYAAEVETDAPAWIDYMWKRDVEALAADALNSKKLAADAALDPEERQAYEEATADHCRQIANALQSSGSAIVVFRTLQAARVAKESGCCLPETEGQTSVHRVHSEPETVLWFKFGLDVLQRDAVISGAITMAVTVACFLAAYTPCALFYLATQKVPGVAPGFWQDMLLGILITVGNLVGLVVVDGVVENFNFRYKSQRDKYVMYLTFGFIMVDTIACLLVTVIYAQGASLDAAADGVSAGYERVLGEQMFGLMPSYLLVPYFAEPLALYAPYYITKLLIRGHKDVTLPAASAWVRSPPMELHSRYADICNNLVVVFIMLPMATKDAMKGAIFYLAFLLVIHILDKVSLLRQARTYHTSRSLHNAFCIIWSVPLAVLAGSFGRYVVISSPHIAAHKHSQVLGIVAATLSHFVLYGIMLHFCGFANVLSHEKNRNFDEDLLKNPGNSILSLTKQARFTDTYEQCLERHIKHGRCATYFNTNPVLLLRGKYLGEVAEGDKVTDSPWRTRAM